ncbi:isochorismate pyruvate lyase [Saccharothrix texasensis]|uniref:Isochorismate pyruvate lyase n=1 Tax=Saccharothrix texasensis TaxID=103734 RepID=A0A3N1HFS5_9PSEU|nr:isochorismate pyruvate lyase [Saccharothrix texasensis]
MPDFDSASSPATPTPAPALPPASLDEVRARIDVIDSELVRLLARRQDLVRAAAAFKVDDQAVRAPDRVAKVIASVRERAAAAGLEPVVAEAVWRAMIGAFIEVELAQHAAGRDAGSPSGA